MKDFMMKHPIIALLMLSEVCAAITSIFKHEENSSLLDREIEVLCDAGNTAIKEIQKSKDRKDPIGFRTS